MTLSEYLAKKKISQRAFAARLGVHQSNLSDWVLGKVTPRLYMVARIQAASGGAVKAEDFTKEKTP